MIPCAAWRCRRSSDPFCSQRVIVHCQWGRKPLPADRQCGLSTTCQRRTEPWIWATCAKKLVKIACVVPEISCRTDRQTDKPVGFYGPIAPQVPNAPSSEPRNNADATFLDPHICRRLLLHAARHAASTAAARYDRREVAEMANAEIAIGANFKIYILRQFCSKSSPIFYNTQETQTQKNDGPEFWNSNSVIFEIFWNFKKGVARSLCGRSGPLWPRPN